MTPTALEVANQRAEKLETIPPITDPMGAHWDQPPRQAILIDDTHAVMSRTSFDLLREYSGSYPSGVYPGKMWKRHDGLFDRDFRARGGKPEWLLCWYGLSERGPEWVTTQGRVILLSDGELPKP